MKRKGIILAGGSGTRLHPATISISKQLLPVYDKPMIYYPLTTLMLADIRDILIISTPMDTPRFQMLLGDGSQFGLHIEYAMQPAPEGIAQAFLIGKRFIGNSAVSLVLGDNLFFGHDLVRLKRARNQKNGASVFAYYVQDPERYGVAEFDDNGKLVSIVEKPKKPKSNYALSGLYFFDNDVCSIAAGLKPSPRGELEIVDVMKHYMAKGALNVEVMERGYAWLDTGTHESLLDAAEFVRTIERRQGRKIACPEEVALRKGFIDEAQVEKLAAPMLKNEYGKYLMRLIHEKGHMR